MRKETYCAHFQTHNFILGYCQNRFTSLMLQKKNNTHKFSQSTLSGQLSHAWTSTAHRVSGGLCSAAQIPVNVTSTVKIGINYANVCWMVTKWCQELSRPFTYTRVHFINKSPDLRSWEASVTNILKLWQINLKQSAWTDRYRGGGKNGTGSHHFLFLLDNTIS